MEDAIANIATVFHWPPSEFNTMALSDLVMWEQKARERSGKPQPQ
ncbi:GpE family phage tail protein [Zhongshania borealis]